ncbi:uncharacterized protein RBU33_022026 isoform 2-T2 [Hipposideros larvatus]
MAAFLRALGSTCRIQTENRLLHGEPDFGCTEPEAAFIPALGRRNSAPREPKPTAALRVDSGPNMSPEGFKLGVRVWPNAAYRHKRTVTTNPHTTSQSKKTKTKHRKASPKTLQLEGTS